MHLEEHHASVGRQVMRLARFAQLRRVLLGQPGIGPVGDDAERLARRGVQELPRQVVVLHAVRAQLGGPHHARDQRARHDGDDEPRRDLEALGPLGDVDRGRVEEHREHDAEKRATARRRDHRGERHRRHQHEHASRVRAGLVVDVRLEDERHQETDGGDDQHDRPAGARPLRRHAVAREVARNQVQQTGHRGRAGEPEDGDRRDVVERAEDVAEIAMRDVGEGAAVRLAAGCERRRRHQEWS